MAEAPALWRRCKALPIRGPAARANARERVLGTLWRGLSMLPPASLYELLTHFSTQAAAWPSSTPRRRGARRGASALHAAHQYPRGLARLSVAGPVRLRAHGRAPSACLRPLCRTQPGACRDKYSALEQSPSASIRHELISDPKHGFNFYGDATRQRIHANRASCTDSMFVAEHLSE